MVGLFERKREGIVEACVRRGVARLEAFGSALRGDFNPDESDLDLLVDFKPMEPYAWVQAYLGLLEDLRHLLDREVDLVMVGAIKNPYIARDIERTKQLLWAG